jgi:hypothetical protein
MPIAAASLDVYNSFQESKCFAHILRAYLSTTVYFHFVRGIILPSYIEISPSRLYVRFEVQLRRMSSTSRFCA